jgi:hypothetical protein
MLSDAERQAAWKEFESKYEELQDKWNKPAVTLVPVNPKKLTDWIRSGTSKLFESGAKAINWEAEKYAYNLGINSFNAYRTFPPRGNQLRKYGPWALVPWSLYDFGASPMMTVDFYYWVNGKSDLRPPDKFLGL